MQTPSSIGTWVVLPPRYSRYIRGVVGFLLFLLLQLPAYSQSSLSGLQECSKASMASVCADLFGVKNSLISANAPGTNAAAQLIGRVGSQAKTVANLNVGGLINSKAGMSVAAAGLAGVGAASLWGISADRLDSLRDQAFEKYCSLNNCGVATSVGIGYSGVVSRVGYINEVVNPQGLAQGTAIVQPGQYIEYDLVPARRFSIPYLQCGGYLLSGCGHRIESSYPDGPAFSSIARSNSVVVFSSSVSSWDDLSAAQKASAADLLTPAQLAGALKGQNVTLPAGYDSFDLNPGAGVGAYGPQVLTPTDAAAGNPADADGATDKAPPLRGDLDGDGDVDIDLNGDGVVDAADQALAEQERANEEKQKQDEEEQKKALDGELEILVPEPSVCDGSSQLVPYAVCKLKSKFPFDFVGSVLNPPSQAPSCPEFEFYGQSLELCWLNTMFTAIKWAVWISFSINGVLNL